MTRDPLAETFERWQRGGDLDALAAVFDATAPELLRVARHLAPDAATAEDLVQTTFLEVLRHPRRFDASRPLVPWLVGILTRQAAKLSRSTRRVETGGEPVELVDRDPKPDDRAAAGELTMAVATALGELQEPYASVVRAHLVDGARPTDLAVAWSRAPGTVRMQLSRGLALLRRALPPGLVVPLAVSRAQALDRVRGAVLDAGTRIGVAVTPLAFLGGLFVVQRILVVGLALFVVLAGVALRSIANDDAGTVASPADDPTVAAALAGPRDDTVTTEAGSAAPRHVAPSIERSELASTMAAAPGYWLVGRVELPSGERGPTRVEVECVGASGSRSVLTDADGSYAIDMTPLFESERRLRGTHALHTHADHPRCTVVQQFPAIDLGAEPRAEGQRIEVRQDFQLTHAALVEGRVAVGLGRDVARAEVAFFTVADRERQVAEPLLEADVDAGGRFALRLPVGGALEIVAFHPQERPVALRFAAKLGERTDVGTIRLDRGAAAIHGRVANLPSPSIVAEVVAQRSVAPGSRSTATTFCGVALTGEGVECTRRSTRADGGGAFALAGLEPGSWRVSVVGVAPHPICPPDAGVVVDAPTAGVGLGADRLTFVVDVVGGSAPICGARVRVTHGSGTDEVGVDAFTDGAGRAAWWGLDSGTYDVRIETPDHEVLTERVDADRARRGPIVLHLRPIESASLRLVVTEPGGRTAGCATLKWKRLDDDGGREIGECEIEFGAEPITLTGLPAGRFQLRVLPAVAGGLPFAMFGAPTAIVETEVTLRAGATTDVTLARMAVGRLCVVAAFAGGEAHAGTLQVTDASGRSIAVTTIRQQPDGWVERGGRFVLEGRNVVTPDLAPGRYDVVMHHASIGTLRRSVEIVAGKVFELRVP